jgi:hypothetical protein
MTYPMPPELLEQLGLEPHDETDAAWQEDHDALGWGGRKPGTADRADAHAELPLSSGLTR